MTEPVRLRVAAERFLCATEAGYLGRLTAGSVRSLALQGGPMSAEEVKAFAAQPQAKAAAQLRRFDEAAKAKGLPRRRWTTSCRMCGRPCGRAGARAG